MPAPQKIGVLTFHRCINYGSYWQAKCLVEGLRRAGHDAVLLDYDCADGQRAEWRCALQPLLPKRSSQPDRLLYEEKVRKFIDAFAALPLSPRFSLEDPAMMESFDLVLIGSDEVWNLAHPWYGGYPLFFGEGLKAERIASYAASFGNYGHAHGLEACWADRLAEFSAISIRDQNSRQVVRKAIGVDPVLVLDPCLQFSSLIEAEGERPDFPYIAVYGHSFPDWFAAAIRTWARAGGRRLLSIGYANDWADEQRLDAGPGEFPALVAGADAVVTNFFHGCVFSLLNARPFACAPSDYRSNKVRDLLASVGASERLATEATAASVYAWMLEEPLEPDIEMRIGAFRDASANYLNHVLG